MRIFNILCYILFAIIIIKITDSVLLWSFVCLFIAFGIGSWAFPAIFDSSYSSLKKICLVFLTAIFCIGLVAAPMLIDEWYFNYDYKKSMRGYAMSDSNRYETNLFDRCSPYRLCNVDTLRSFGISVPDRSRKKIFWKFEKGQSYEDAEEYISEFKKQYRKDSVGDFRLYEIEPLLDRKEKLYGLKFTYDYRKCNLPMPQDISPSMYECISAQYGTAYLRSSDKYHNCAFWNKKGIGVAMICRIPYVDGDKISSYSCQCIVYIYHTRSLWERFVLNKEYHNYRSLNSDCGIKYLSSSEFLKI